MYQIYTVLGRGDALPGQVVDAIREGSCRLAGAYGRDVSDGIEIRGRRVALESEVGLVGRVDECGSIGGLPTEARFSLFVFGQCEVVAAAARQLVSIRST